MKLQAAIGQFLTQLEADGKSPLTVRIYRSELERFARWPGAKAHLSRIQPETLALYLTDPVALLSPDGKRRSVRTVNRTKTALRLLFRYLTELGTIKRNPARLLRNARIDLPYPVCLTDDERRRFLRALSRASGRVGERDRVLFTILLRTGMRLSAALALRVGDVDFSMANAITRGKHGRVQRVFFPGDVTKLLSRYLKSRGIETGPIFRGRRGRLSARQAQYRFRALTQLAGIERHLTVHSLRHTFATNLRRKTGDLRIVQAALGHRSLATTEVYARVDEEEVRRAVAG